MAVEVLIDTDPGMGFVGSDVDDNLALFWALKDARVSVKGITLTYGNVELKEAWLSLSKTLSLTKRQDVAFALGCDKPLVRPYKSARQMKIEIAKEVGLPLKIDTILLENVELLKPVPCSAPDFIVSTVKDNPGLTILALGPLTNIALAIKKDPVSMASIREIVIMGGTIKEPGNISPTSEFNVWCDPEAAAIVFASGLPITMIGLDVTHKVKIFLNEVEEVLARDTDVGHFVFESIKKWIEVRRDLFGQDYFNPHDAVAFGYLLYPELYRVEEMYIQVEVCGFCTKGQVIGVPHEVVRRYPWLNFGKENLARVCMDIEEGRFKAVFLNFLGVMSRPERR